MTKKKKSLSVYPLYEVNFNRVKVDIPLDRVLESY